MSLTPERRRELLAKAQAYHSNVAEVLPYLGDRGISDQVADMFLLGCVSEGREYAGRLSIPYLAPNGVVQMKYRCTVAEHGDHKGEGISCPKYLYDQGTHHALYNAQVLPSVVDIAVITEGELDAICVQAYTGIAAVAYPGVKTWKAPENSHWSLCFEAVSEVIVVADGDEEGRKAALYVAESIGSQARVVQMPDGQDANSFIASQGAKAFEERIR